MSAVDQLLAMDMLPFRQLVDRELRGKATSEESAALRSPALAEKWYTALTAMTKSVDGQLGARRADYFAARARFTKQMLEARTYAERAEAERSWAEYREGYGRNRAATLRFKSGLDETLIEARLRADQAKLTTHGLRFWQFADAPPNLQLLSQNGGDEDWLMLVPSEYVESTDAYENEDGTVQTTVQFAGKYGALEYVMEKLDARARPEYHVLANGDVVVIASHA